MVEYDGDMSAESVEPSVGHSVPAGSGTPSDSTDPDVDAERLSAAWLAEARWQRANEEDADAERRRAPVSARAHTWAMTLGGPKLAALLADVDVASLSDDECVVFAQAVTRQQAWTDALLFDVTAAFVEHRPGPDETQRRFGFPHGPGVEERIQLGGEGTVPLGSFAASEWAAALKTSRAIATRLIGDSLDLCHRLPAISMCVRAGHGDTRRARMIADRTRFLDPRLVALVQDAVVPILAVVTARQLDRIIDQVIAAHDPASAPAKAEQVKQDRRVWIGQSRDDHADIAGTLDGIGAEVLDRRLDQLANLLGVAVRTHGESAGFGPAGESHDQRRARALILLATPTEVARLLRLTRSQQHPTTAAGASTSDDQTAAASADLGGLLSPVTLYIHLRADHTLNLEGLGIVSMPTVADLLAQSTATVKVQPVIDLNATYHNDGYHPSHRLREQTILITDTCRFPFCQRPARDCDHEHPVPWPRGPTNSTNAGTACRGHHRVKTHGNWQVHQPCTGVYVWQAPTGHVYIVTPNGTHAMT